MAEKPVMHQKIPLNVVPSRSMCSLKTQNIIQQTKSQQGNTNPHWRGPSLAFGMMAAIKQKKDSSGISVWKQTPKSRGGEFIHFTLREQI